MNLETFYVLTTTIKIMWLACYLKHKQNDPRWSADYQMYTGNDAVNSSWVNFHIFNFDEIIDNIKWP